MEILVQVAFTAKMKGYCFKKYNSYDVCPITLERAQILSMTYLVETDSLTPYKWKYKRSESLFKITAGSIFGPRCFKLDRAAEVPQKTISRFNQRVAKLRTLKHTRLLNPSIRATA